MVSKEPASYPSSLFIMLDTNILLHQFDVVVQFVEDVEREKLPITIIIPGIVISELDGQKNRDGLGWFARRASAWLLKKFKERKSVRGQANEETCKASGNWRIQEAGGRYDVNRINDNLILDCCLYFKRLGKTFLCTGDKNLCNDCEPNNISTISPTRRWDSRNIISTIYGPGAVDVSRFAPYHISYRDPTSGLIRLVDESTTVDGNDDDKMMVDDDTSIGLTPEILRPSHALDLLHTQVVEHFTRLLIELVGRVGGVELQKDKRMAASRHAPAWQRTDRPYTRWDAAECLEYLGDMRRAIQINPRLEVFLSLPYRTRGARRGQDWSRKDWFVAMEGLGEVGRIWDEETIVESLEMLSPHLSSIFALRLRPTGI
ncbi:hypothetical protein AMATHDRAFT_139261 [Amanita thiersii Skay4041]|uniref:PIN domain-containing protein n=1 Tax=Amanita thiersii Skay4041 TaxID=703135 RepID=A0A2A9NWU5_9AGAR|nr:hypothetical protein AMATHDRAFT_139261 [Amanita thiersii Skay4041]